MFSFGRIQLRWVFLSSILSLLVLLFFFLTGSAYSAQVTLAWDPDTDPNLAGYRIYYGLLMDQYSSSVDAGNRTSYTLSGQSVNVGVTNGNDANNGHPKKLPAKPSPKSMLRDSTPEMKEKLWGRNSHVRS